MIIIKNSKFRIVLYSIIAIILLIINAFSQMHVTIYTASIEGVIDFIFALVFVGAIILFKNKNLKKDCISLLIISLISLIITIIIFPKVLSPYAKYYYNNICNAYGNGYYAIKIKDGKKINNSTCINYDDKWYCCKDE